MPKSVRKNRRAESRADFGRRSRRQTGRQNSIFFSVSNKKKIRVSVLAAAFIKIYTKNYFQNEIKKNALKISESARKNEDAT